MTEAKTRGRQRSDESERAILAAAFQLLKTKPLREITVEAIAKAAGVGKMTIYKWWPNKSYLALDALERAMNKTVAMPDTGDGERDLVELLNSSMNFYSRHPGRLFVQFLAEAQEDSKFAALLRERFLRPRRRATREILDRAVKRGELNQMPDVEMVIDLIFGPVVFRLMAGHNPLNRVEATAMISTLMRGIGSKSYKAKRRSTALRNLTR